MLKMHMIFEKYEQARYETNEPLDIYKHKSFFGLSGPRRGTRMLAVF